MTDHDGVEEGSTCCQCGKDLGAPVWYRRECGAHKPESFSIVYACALFITIALGVANWIVWGLV